MTNNSLVPPYDGDVTVLLNFRAFGFLSLVATTLYGAGCTSPSPREKAPSSRTHTSTLTSTAGDHQISVRPSAPAQLYQVGRQVKPERLDLDGIRARGTLRLLVPGSETTGFLPRKDLPIVGYLAQAEAFARHLGVKPVRVVIPNYEDLMPALLEGRGDIIATGLTITDDRKKKVAFARSTQATREVVVGLRMMEDAPRSSTELSGREIHLRRSSSYAESVAALDIEDLRVVYVPEHLDTAEIISEVASGQRPLTVADASILEAVQMYEPNVEGLFTLGTSRAIGWAVRPSSPKLRAAIDRFHTERALGAALKPIFKGDLNGIRKRGVLRVLTRNNPVTYFIYRGQPIGFEYELVRLLADELNVRLAMIVAPDRASLVPWLLEGKGDIIAASMTITEARKQNVVFSRPYMFVDEVLVKAKGASEPASIEGLAGRTVHARPSSGYWESLRALQAAGLKFTMIEAQETLETETLIGQVASSHIPLTVADSHILQVEQAYGALVEKGPRLSDAEGPKSLAFAFRPDSKALKAYVDTFVKKEYRGLKYNIYKKRYFENIRKIRRYKKARVDRTGRISPYDDLIKKYGQRFGLDWRLLAAQAYVESGFNPQAKSWVGAKGLFQVMPATGRSLGFTKLTDPEQGTHAGVKYLSRLISRFDPELLLSERIWFALAAYNAGLGHVYDARRLARQKKWDANKWFGNVEKAMLLLSERKYAKKARHGYCRGGEPVAYVRHIRELYEVYSNVGGERRDAP